MTDQQTADPVARVAVGADVRRGPVKRGWIDVSVRCLVQANGDGTVTISVPRLSHDAWTGQTEAEARMKAHRALDDF
jgi:hypothetical protein